MVHFSLELNLITRLNRNTFTLWATVNGVMSRDNTQSCRQQKWQAGGSTRRVYEVMLFLVGAFFWEPWLPATHCKYSCLMNHTLSFRSLFNLFKRCHATFFLNFLQNFLMVVWLLLLLLLLLLSSSPKPNPVLFGFSTIETMLCH